MSIYWKKLNIQIEHALKYVVDNYNNNYHSTIKFSPIKVFFSEDVELFNKVKENAINSSKNYDINLSLFEKNDYVLLFNKFHLKALRNKNIKILEKSKVKNEKCII